MHISKARMQRWLEPTSGLCNGGSYFDELFEACGERQLTIIFSGTREDLSDLMDAAKNYETAHPQFRIEIIGDERSARNDSRQKLQRLKDILSAARESEFRALLPSDFGKYADKKIFRDAADVVNCIELGDWSKGFMFRTGDWQMLCVAFPFDEMRTEKLREKFRDLSECLSRVENRHFERERFLLMCRCENDAVADGDNTAGAVKKLLTEYGLQDLKFLMLSAEDMRALSDVSIERDNERLRELKRSVMMFRGRYAEQYRLSKMHDALRKILIKSGWSAGAQENLRQISELMPNWSDNKKMRGDGWIVGLFKEIESVLEFGNTEGVMNNG